MKSLLFFYFLASILFSQNFSRLIDEDFSDWPEEGMLLHDTEGDNGSSGIDFGAFSASCDEHFVYFYIEIGKEINLQNGNTISIFIDNDNNIQTGFNFKGIGADFKYTFGARKGEYYIDGGGNSFYQNDVGLISSPTVTSTRFEFCLNRNSMVGGMALFPEDSIKVVLADEESGDLLPDNEGGVTVILNTELNYSAKEFSMRKSDGNFRIISYNVHRDDLFETGNDKKFGRILKALDPDIIGFQEIYNHTADETAAKVKEITEADEKLYSAKAGPDIIMLSKYPIEKNFSIDGNGAFIINLGEEYNSRLMVINAHTPCCDNNAERQREIDAIMKFVREAKAEGNSIGLEKNTPVIILGDMNLVGFSEQLNTLLTGNIVNESSYGPDFSPDWDDTDLKDLRPMTAYLPQSFTWNSRTSSFSPGRLDFMVFTNSVIESSNNFVFFTQSIPPDTLEKYGVFGSDSYASDHIPIVGDFHFTSSTDIKDEGIGKGTFHLEQNFPNPFNPSTTITYSISAFGDSPGVTSDKKGRDMKADDGKSNFESLNVTLKIYDILGKEVITLVDEQQKAGSYLLEFNAARLPSGVYFYRLEAGSFSQAKKMILLN